MYLLSILSIFFYFNENQKSKPIFKHINLIKIALTLDN